jgi:hypothetical protein
VLNEKQKFNAPNKKSGAKMFCSIEGAKFIFFHENLATNNQPRTRVIIFGYLNIFPPENQW